MTDTNATQQEKISREIASLDGQRTRDIEELLSGVDARREEELVHHLDTYHLLTVSKLSRLALLQRAQ